MISNGVDNAGLLLLMYPRPVFVAAATLDFFPIEGTRKAFQEVSALYARFNHAHNIAMAESYNGHQYSDENQQAAFEFLDQFNRLPRRTHSSPAKELDEKTVQCTRTGQVMLDFEDARSLVDVIRDYYMERRSKTKVSIRQLYYAKGYPGISAWDAIKYHGVTQERHIAWETAGTSENQGISIDRYALVSQQQSRSSVVAHSPDRKRELIAACFGLARMERLGKLIGRRSNVTSRMGLTS